MLVCTEIVHTVSLPVGTISEAGRKEIERQLPTRLPSDWQWKAKVGGKGEYVGSFAKRVAKYFHKQGTPLTSDQLGVIGSLVSQYSASQTDYTIDYTSDFNWQAGDFGDGGSCYWGCRSAAKDMISENGGQAVRFYKDGNGTGRAWMLPHDNNWILFNGYGLDLAQIAQVVAADLGQSYKRIRLENNGDTDGTLWINSGVGYVVGSVEDYEYDRSIDLCIEDDSQCCQDCGCRISHDDCHCVCGDRYVCDSCFDDYSYCDQCEKYFSSDDVYYIDEQGYCDHCRRCYCTKCVDCGEWHRETNTTSDGEVCASCLDNYCACESCGLRLALQCYGR